MKIRQDIQQRDSAELDIRYFDGGSTAKHLAVPITPACRRRFRLMQEDCIELSFSLAEAVHIGIGDYVYDPIFGHYYITEEQMPKYNTRTGGYDYTLRFDADYLRWKNYIHCLVADGGRKETSWRLTDRLESHAQAIVDNVHIIFPPTVNQYVDTETGVTTYTSTGYGVEISGVGKAAEARYIDYNGTDIIGALNTIAESYECEWWVTDDKVTIGETTYDHTLHFGKCEDSGEAYEMRLGDNVESMDVSRDQQTYANRIYVYGGTQNIPEDYGRHLVFTNTSSAFANRFKDNTREITLDMILGEGSITPTVFTLGSWSNTGRNPRILSQRTDTIQLNGKQTFAISLLSSVSLMNDDWAGTDTPELTCVAMLHYGTDVVQIHPDVTVGKAVSGEGRSWYADIAYNKEITLSNEDVAVYLDIVWTITYEQYSSHLDDQVVYSTSGTMTATKDASRATKPVVVVFNGSEYNCTYYGETKDIGPKPSGMTTGSQYTISNLNLLNVPLKHYTEDYDLTGMRYIGDRRLHLPGTVRYVEKEVGNASQRVEAAVIFNDIFPHLVLRIKRGTLGREQMTQRVDHQDGSVSYERWTQYSFQLEKSDGTAFDFKVSYLLDGHKLQGGFSAPQTLEGQEGCKLSGMTFDLGYNAETKRYKIIRNEDYGALLPNEYLYPSEGDTLIITGWNPRAISEMGLVSDAESELEGKGNEYLQALQDGQFTINAHMMSRTMQFYPFCNGSDSSGRRMYGLIDAGCKVTVNHAALPGGSKTSRVLGYEYKLDMPYDTPTYIIGETEAYSRLKQLEKQLTKL